MNNYFTTTRSAFDFFDDLFNGHFVQPKLIFNDLVNPMRFNSIIQSNAFPPANISVDPETNDIFIEVGLAGCTEEDISLSYENKKLKLFVKNGNPGEMERRSRLIGIQKGLKRGYNIDTAWIIDDTKYNIDNIEVAFINGLLNIHIKPKEQIKQVTKNIFGKLNFDEQKKLEQKD